MRQGSQARTEQLSVSRYLLTNEYPNITIRLHPAVLAGPSVLASVGLAAAWKLAGRSVRPGVAWGAGLLMLSYALRQAAAWPVTYLTVTHDRMVLISGLASRTAAAVALDKVTGLTLRRSVLGRILGYGTLVVSFPGRRQALGKIRYVPYPEQIYLEISGLVWPGEEEEAARPVWGGNGMTADVPAEPVGSEQDPWSA